MWLMLVVAYGIVLIFFSGADLSIDDIELADF